MSEQERIHEAGESLLRRGVVGVASASSGKPQDSQMRGQTSGVLHRSIWHVTILNSYFTSSASVSSLNLTLRFKILIDERIIAWCLCKS